MKRKTFLFIVLVAFFLIFSIHALNSESSQTEKGQKVLEHKVTVTLKLVQVSVTDKSGRPITDLKKSDFELYDNGELKPITDFEKYVLSVPSVKTDLQEEKATPPFTPILNRKFFLFFDFAHNNESGIFKSKKAALHFIDTKLIPTDEVGLLSYSSNKGLILHADLTPDHQKVRKVIERFGLKRIIGEPGVLLEMNEDSKENQVTGRDSQEEQEREKLSEENKGDLDSENIILNLLHHNFLEQMKNLAKALRYISGYKHIIFFSSYYINNWRFKKIEEEMMKEFSSSNCTVYAVDTLDLASVLSDANKTMEDPFAPFEPTRFKSSIVSGSLRQLSHSTGGSSGNINDYKEFLEEVRNVTGTYYVLGYYINEKTDGKYHKIKVKVKRKGCKIHAQGGYFNPTPFNEFSKLEKQLQFSNLALKDYDPFQTSLHFPIMTLPYLVKGESGIVMISKIPMEGIQEICKEKVELINLIIDEKNNIIDSKRWEVNFSKLPKKDIYYYSLSSLSPGRYKYRVIIRNLETGKAAKASSSFTIPETPDSGLVIDPPLLLIPEKDPFYLKGTLIEKKDGGEESIGLLNIYPYDIDQFSPLIDELSQGTKSILAVVRCSTLNMEKPDIEFSVHLIHLSTGKKMPLYFSVLHEYQENDIHLSFLRLTMNELMPGNYILYFFIEEVKSQSRSQGNTTFKVK